MLRDGQTLAVQATLKAQAREIDGAELDAAPVRRHFSELPERYRQQGVRGVVISKIAKGSRAEKNNLAAGDLVLGVNREGVEDMNAFRAKVATTPQRLVLVLQRGGQRGELEMR